MLRVRPTIATSRLTEDRKVFEALGMIATEEANGWVVLDAGHGRIALRSPWGGAEPDAARQVTFGVEIRDPEVFARRTAADGGTASLELGARGAKVRVTGPDGFTFLAEPTGDGATVPGADPQLSVRMEWLTPDLPGAAATLAAIGARPREAPPKGTPGSKTAPAETPEAPQTPGAPQTPHTPGSETAYHDFTAKNGGILAARRSTARGCRLAFEYEGDLAAVVRRLAETGATVSPTREGIAVVAPGGTEFTVMTPRGRML